MNSGMPGFRIKNLLDTNDFTLTELSGLLELIEALKAADYEGCVPELEADPMRHLLKNR